jgi:hypothetical protein
MEDFRNGKHGKMRGLMGRGFGALAGIIVLLVAVVPALALETDLALTPPMGFNNFNATGCGGDFNETLVKTTVDLLVTSGLKDAGYEYVNFDDCWALPMRDGAGKLVPDPTRFPSGIRAIADYVHSKGLKIGIYTSAGTKTCNTNGFPGALGHEQSDAEQFANWGIDYLKYDNCNSQNMPAIQRYNAMRAALQTTRRPIVYSICEWGQNQPWLWGKDVGHMWRTTGDIADNYDSMLGIVKQNAPLASYAGPGHWNDPDMLEVGNGGMTDTEYRSHFSLWAIMAAPLLIGSDLRRATPGTLEILSNREVITIDQDAKGVQGTVLSNQDGHWVFTKPLKNGDVAVALFNETGQGATISTRAAAVGLPDRDGYLLRDLWKHSSTETAGTIAAFVPAHGTVMYRVSPDPNWRDYPPAVSFGVTINSAAQGSAGHYVLPGRAFEIASMLTNDGGVATGGVALSLSGPMNHEGISYEAETNSTLSGAASLSICGGCSDGQKVSFIGNGAANWVRLSGINASAAGEYRLTIWTAISGTRSLFVSVNDGPGVEVAFTGTNVDAPVAVTIPVTLAVGANSIRFYNDTASGPDLDRVVVTAADALRQWTLRPPDSVTRPQLGSNQRFDARWNVTPPPGADPGSYELAVTGNSAASTFRATIRIVVPDSGVR